MKCNLFKIIIILSACVWVNAFAQDAGLKERRELADAMMRANQQGMDPVKLVTGIVESMKSSLTSTLKRTNPNQTEAYYTRAAEVITRETSSYMEGVMVEILPPMTESIANLYADRFSASELKELIKIYENPLLKRGLAVLAEDTPKLIAPHMESIQLRAQALAPRINQALAREGLLPAPKP